MVSISEFYAGTSVFITGGTGYLGKVIIEKILYSCPQVKNVYMLVREKKNATVEERMKSFLECSIFDRLREKRPEDLQKIVEVVGDTAAPNLGIEPAVEELLIEKVSVVIHSAATVRFNETLEVALNVNVLGTRRVMDLSHRMKNLKAFVHISTAYCNVNQDVLEEKVYPPPMDLAKAYEIARNVDAKINKKTLGGHPNAYSFSKVLAENLVKNLHGDIPTTIVRPSVVTPAKSEPMEGWVDNWFGGTALLVAVGKGYLRFMVAKRDIIIDIIPVDYVANAILIAASKCRTENLKVVNACCGSKNSITLEQLTHSFCNQCIQHKFNDFPYPAALAIKYAWIGWLLEIVLELVPAYLADLWLYIRGKRGRFVRLQSQIAMVRKLFDNFTNRSWIMRTDNLSALQNDLSPEDARLFPCDPSDICWEDYVGIYFHGVKRFLFDEKKIN